MTEKLWQALNWYEVDLPPNLLTPALAIYPEVIRNNVAQTLRLLGGDAKRWRPHLKTVKAAFAIRMLVDMGITQAKCATPLELQTAFECGMTDVIVAYPVVGPTVRKILEIARAFPKAKTSAVVESVAQVEQWRNTGMRLFIDINPGMNRTGIEECRWTEILNIARAISNSGCTFGGLHYYDGHITDLDLAERTRKAHSGYIRLMEIAHNFHTQGIVLSEVITAGSTTFPCSLTFQPFRVASFHHVCSPGTLVYGDLTSLSQLPDDFGYRPAALVLSRFISQPTASIATLDAGHKAVSVDLGVPDCLILEMPEAVPLKPSEEHLPVDISALTTPPEIGTLVHLVPRHVCTTVNNFNHCIVLEKDKLPKVEDITARGRHAPIPQAEPLSSDTH